MLKNILVGEVWLCSGQSNMEMAINVSANAAREIASANYPNIRLFSVARKTAAKPQSDCAGNWVSCSPQTVPGFSAVAYFFGRKLHKQLDVPIGLIHSSWGATPAEAWMSRETLVSYPEFEPILRRYAEGLANYPWAKKEYERKMKEWKQASAKARARR